MNNIQTDSFRKITRPSVVEEIIEVFKNKLINGELKPGDKLPPETQLVQQLGVGRTALRESIKMLAALGVVDVIQGDGTYVVDHVSSATLNPMVFAILIESGMSRELLELRTLLEVGYCQLAAQKAHPEDIIRIKNAASVFEKIIETNPTEVDELTRADLAFHFAIMETTQNPLIIQISKATEELFFGSIKRTISNMEGRRWGVEGHKKIIAAIESKDMNSIKHAIEISLARWSKDLDEVLPNIE